jgi:3-oxoacyl-[acyl-carrier-protein] synthase I
MSALYLEGCGAVTPVGLESFATCAAIRARISRIQDEIYPPPPREPLKGARVLAGRKLRATPREWLMNLAVKALDECAASLAGTLRPVTLLVQAPEPFRAHPGMIDASAQSILSELSRRTRLVLTPASRVLTGGASGVIDALDQARSLLRRGGGGCCIIGGFDSLLNETDIARLQRSDRLHSPHNPQGVIPGEAAAFVAVSISGYESSFVPLARLSGLGLANEPHPVSGPDYSVGDGLRDAVERALQDAGSVRESEIGFIVSSHNGERYAAWENQFAHARSYRSRRERLDSIYPATSVGDVGVGAAALSLIVAAVAIARGHAPAPVALCESRSEEALRGACLVAANPGPSPFVAPGVRRDRNSRG